MNLRQSLDGDGRAEFLEALALIPPAQAAQRPAPGAWSALECVEHAVLFEQRYLEWLREAHPVRPAPNAARETKLYHAIRGRQTKVPTPDPLLPARRYGTLGQARQAFEAARDATVAFAAGQQELYGREIEHPHFGRVNGVELLQLVDGHTRRHAAQLVEIAAALKTMSRAKNTKAFRDAPDLPGTLTPLVALADRVIEGVHWQDADQAGLEYDRLEITGSKLERVKLSAARFSALVLKDVELRHCDLANLRATRVTFQRVEFIDCRLTGLTATSADWQNVLVEGCDLRYAQLAGARFVRCEWQTTSLQEIDWQSAGLAGARLRQCDLTQADLRRAELDGADLRGSNVDTLIVNGADLRGAIVDAAQALALARVFGLQIR